MIRDCIERCGRFTTGTRCVECQARRDARRNASPKRQAYRDPAYRAQPKGGICSLCGKAGADTRDHVIPLDVQMRQWGKVMDHRSQPAHRSCNSARGARC